MLCCDFSLHHRQQKACKGSGVLAFRGVPFRHAGVSASAGLALSAFTASLGLKSCRLSERIKRFSLCYGRFLCLNATALAGGTLPHRGPILLMWLRLGFVISVIPLRNFQKVHPEASLHKAPYKGPLGHSTLHESDGLGVFAQC